MVEPTKRVSDSMLGVLRMARDGTSLYSLCFNRAEHGARTGTITALRRRGLLIRDEITPSGRDALSAAEAKQGKGRVA